MRPAIVLAPAAVQDLKRLTARNRTQVVMALETHLRHEPTRTSRSRVKRLRGLTQPQYRLRVDDFRIFYDVRGATVEVLAIVRKDDADDWLKGEGRRS